MMLAATTTMTTICYLSGPASWRIGIAMIVYLTAASARRGGLARFVTSVYPPFLAPLALLALTAVRMGRAMTPWLAMAAASAMRGGQGWTARMRSSSAGISV
mmetsp:Transcript_9135/g.24787  ORF Transcript_9135/g.24787 Transcript_9135/m.24787 type:complete len:102 (-) Transcript_9135:402-707(-)